VDLKKFLKKYKTLKVGMLTNQSAFFTDKSSSYHFQFFSKKLNLVTLFMPEHGLFAELQDQVSGSQLKYNYGEVGIINLYGDTEDSLVAKEKAFDDLDLIMIDIRDVGSRYYTFLTSAFYLLKSVSEYNKRTDKKSIMICVVDSPNPIGRKIEGTPLQKEFESFVGVFGVVHRHGLTPAELLSYYNYTYSLSLQIDILPIGELYIEEENSFYWIPPSPNIPTRNTCFVYPGQCLLEGTNLSEGRGTTRPFEIFGAPFIDIQDPLLKSVLETNMDGTYILRPLFFQPTFHKFTNQRCGGFQIIIQDPKKFHSLLFTLHFIKTIKDYYPENFEYLKGPYEFRSDRPAIELLVGDSYLLDYLSGKTGFKMVRQYLNDKEAEWKKERKPYLLY
jgi:uncharacterized protein YbbC (DUF1343 family)